MKKFILAIILSLVSFTVYAEPETTDIDTVLEPVTIVKCESATEMVVKDINNKYLNIRLLTVDLSVEDTKEIDKQVCEMINNSKNIKIEKDVIEKDQYNRYLVWMYLDDSLLQEKLIKEGLSQVNYVTADYKHINDLCDIQKEAIINRVGIWSSGTKEVYCNSGIDLIKKEEIKKEEVQEEEKRDSSTLRLMVFISSGILLLTLVLKMGLKNAKEKR